MKDVGGQGFGSEISPQTGNVLDNHCLLGGEGVKGNNNRRVYYIASLKQPHVVRGLGGEVFDDPLVKAAMKGMKEREALEPKKEKVTVTIEMLKRWKESIKGWTFSGRLPNLPPLCFAKCTLTHLGRREPNL